MAARISAAGTWTNRSVVRANDLEVRGTDIDNNVTGEMSGARSIVADGTLTNRGLIDGGQARIEAGTVDNLGSGRVYGDRLAIQAGTCATARKATRPPSSPRASGWISAPASSTIVKRR